MNRAKSVTVNGIISHDHAIQCDPNEGVDRENK